MLSAGITSSTAGSLESIASSSYFGSLSKVGAHLHFQPGAMGKLLKFTLNGYLDVSTDVGIGVGGLAECWVGVCESVVKSTPVTTVDGPMS